MLPRRSLALVTGALMLALPALSSCGFDKATDRVYVPANGINYRQGEVYVLNAVIAAAQPGSGTLIATFTNQSETDSATLDAVAGAAGNAVQGGEFTPIEIAPRGAVNLADETSDAITVSGNFGAGDVIPMSLNFTDGDVIQMNVPVVYACQQYTGLDTSASSSSSSTPSSTASDGGSMSPLATDDSTDPGDQTATPLDTATAEPSNPEQATPSPSDTGSASESTSESAGESTSESTGATPSAGASTYVCGTSGGTGGRN